MQQSWFVLMQLMQSNVKNSLPIRESLDWIQILFRKKILILLGELSVDLKDF